MSHRLHTIKSLTAWLLIVVVLQACHGIPANLPANPGEHVASGDEVQVMQELTIPAHKASVMLQRGRIVAGSVDRFEAGCRFVMTEIKAIPRTIAPGEFRVTGVRHWEDFLIPDIRLSFSGGEFINYEITLYLQSEQQPEVYSLVCRHDDDHIHGRHLKVSEMQQALGELARIVKR